MFRITIQVFTFSILSNISLVAQQNWTKLDSVSYAMGINLGETWKKQGISQLNSELMIKGMNDILTNKTQAIPKEAGDKVFQTYAALVKQNQIELSKVEGKSFREKNK